MGDVANNLAFPKTWFPMVSLTDIVEIPAALAGSRSGREGDCLFRLYCPRQHSVWVADWASSDEAVELIVSAHWVKRPARPLALREDGRVRRR